MSKEKEPLFYSSSSEEHYLNSNKLNLQSKMALEKDFLSTNKTVLSSAEESLINSIKELEIKERTSDIGQELKLLHCPICNIGLNSIFQAKQHLVGTRHMKRCKDINPLKRRMLEAPSAQVFGKSSRKSFFCAFCNLELNSDSQADAHFSSSRHQKREASTDNESLANTKSVETSQLCCNICDISFTSEIHAQAHYSGKKHAAKSRANHMPPAPSQATSAPVQNQVFYNVSAEVEIQAFRNEAAKTAGPIWSDESPAAPQMSAWIPPVTGKTLLQCQLCRMSVNSELQLKAHYTSKKHQQAIKGMTKQSCGRGRGFMLNQLRQSLSSPGKSCRTELENSSHVMSNKQPPYDFQFSNQSQNSSGFFFGSARPRNDSR